MLQAQVHARGAWPRVGFDRMTWDWWSNALPLDQGSPSLMLLKCMRSVFGEAGHTNSNSNCLLHLQPPASEVGLSCQGANCWRKQLDESTARRHLKSPRSPDLDQRMVTVMVMNGQGRACGQRSRSHLTLKIQRSRSCSRSNLLVTFEAWGSTGMFASCFVAIGPLLVEI